MAIILRGAYKQMIGPTEAKTIIEDYAYPHQRNVRGDHVAMLAKAMANGEFVPGTLIKMAELAGKIYLVDGQHRLHAIIKSGTPIEFAICDFDADTEEDVANIYGHTDYGGRSRTVAVYFAALQAATKLGMSAKQVNSLANASGLLLSGGKDARTSDVSLETRLALVDLYAPHMIRWYDQIGRIPSVVGQAANRAYVQAFAALTSRWPASVQGRTTEEFWRGVIRDDAVAEDDPRKIVNRTLILSKIVSTPGAYGKASMITTPEGFMQMAIAYNYYLAGKSVKTIRLNGRGDEPITITGVPRDTADWAK